MGSQRTNILICGVSRSGSQAVVDLLREYKNIGVFPGEFNDFRAPGMISDQLDENLYEDWPCMIGRKYSPLGMKSRIGQFLLSNSNIPWLKYFLRFEPIGRRVKRWSYVKSILGLEEKLVSDISLKDKINESRKWVNIVGEIYAGNNDQNYFLIDQPITPVTKFDVWTEVLQPFKMICCIRNPKDQLANILKDRFVFLPYGAPHQNWGGNILESLHGRTRSDALKLFIADILIKYKRINMFLDKLGDGRFLLINFESLIKKYKNTVSEIEHFLPGISDHHNMIKKYFDPGISVVNVNYSKDYLRKSEYDLIEPLMKEYEKLSRIAK